MCNSADILQVGMEIESISGSDRWVSGSAAAGWARGFALPGSSFRGFGYQVVRECFTLCQRSQQMRSMSFQTGQNKITRCTFCVGVNVADVIPVMFFITCFLGGLLSEHACSFPAAHCFIFTRPRTLSPQISWSTAVQHF